MYNSVSKCPSIPNIYLQNELKHFGQEILVVYRVLGHFELYQVSMYNFCAKFLKIFSNIFLGANAPK